MYYSNKKTSRIRKFEKTLDFLIGKAAGSLKDGPLFENECDYVSRDFYEGTPCFLSSPAENAAWSLGYASASLIPPDWRTHDYYLGGYMVADNKFKNRVESVADDMRARCIAVSDGSGRGVNVFCVIDSIGIANADIRNIRSELKKSLSEKNNNIILSSVNVCSTHTHSCIDTEGLWTGGPRKILENYKRSKRGITLLNGTDKHYMEFLTATVVGIMLKAIEKMTAGKLTLSQMDIGDKYFGNRNRPSASAVDTRLTRLLFRPSDASTPTIIASIAAHPDCAGLATSNGSGTGREISGDYIYYCDEFIQRAGYNFIFFNGAICALYMNRGPSNDGMPLFHRYEESERFGVELAKNILSINMTLDEILADPLLSDKQNEKRDKALADSNGGVYTPWYTDHKPVADAELDPVFNIRLSEVTLACDNPIIKLAGKLNLTSFKVLSDNGRYKIKTEIGKIEIGCAHNTLTVAMVPGEFCCDLLKGGSSLTAAGSFSGEPFEYPTLWQILGEGTVCMGLANDAIGYIVPDNDYVLGDFANHYHETLSLGKTTGSTIIKAFQNI